MRVGDGIKCVHVCICVSDAFNSYTIESSIITSYVILVHLVGIGCYSFGFICSNVTPFQCVWLFDSGVQIHLSIGGISKEIVSTINSNLLDV